jgi:hypothetical protein
VCRNRVGRRDGCRLRGELVFVDQAAEQVTAADTIEVDHVSEGLLVERRRLAERRPLSQRAVRAVLVVVRRVGREDVVEVTTADDQEPVEALAADAADPTLGVRPRLRSPYGRFDDTDAFGMEDVVEGSVRNFVYAVSCVV